MPMDCVIINIHRYGNMSADPSSSPLRRRRTRRFKSGDNIALAGFGGLMASCIMKWAKEEKRLMFEHNPIARMLGIKYPIFQGGMAWTAASRTYCCFHAGDLA